MQCLSLKSLGSSFVFCILFSIVSCHKSVPVNDITMPPKIKAEDEKYTNVFSPLDGEWKGVFRIYLDTLPGTIDQALLNKPEWRKIQHLPIQLSDTILVEQKYHSSSPYFQTVNITDYYPGKDLSINSEGVNKIQNGKMWCVVHKPDETIIHEGKMEGQETIIWHRNVKKPLSKEYFRETVLENTYEIIGWGYYGQADTTKMPPYWFFGKYYRP